MKIMKVEGVGRVYDHTKPAQPVQVPPPRPSPNHEGVRPGAPRQNIPRPGFVGPTPPNVARPGFPEPKPK